jgi:multidrug efflux system outer membrane protein
MGPDYQSPFIKVPKKFRFEPTSAMKTANIEWWKQFNDRVLDELIAEALANNWNIKIAAANIDQAYGALLATRSAMFPQISYDAAGSHNRLSKNTTLSGSSPNPFNNFQVLGNATWEIDFWGRIRRLSESAKAQVFASNEARRSVILSLVGEVGISYIQLRALDEELRISKKTLKAYADSLKYFESQHQYGQVSNITVQQARSQYQTAAAQIPKLERQIAETENVLSLLLGRNPGPIPRGRNITALRMPDIPKDLPSTLLEQRPDILQSEQQLIAANAQIGAAKALYFPSISLTGSYGWQSTALSNLIRSSSVTSNYGASMTGPIFTAGNVEGQVIQAKGATEAALLNYKSIVQKAFADVSNAFVARRELEKQLKAEMKIVEAYQKYKDLSWHRYHEGYSPYLEVLFAESQLYPAELHAIQTKAATFVSLINIYMAMGGGWVTRANEMTCDQATNPTLHLPQKG